MPVYLPSFTPPWCCSPNGPSAGRSGSVIFSITVLPLSTTVTRPLDGDLEGVPLADVVVGIHLWRGGGLDRRGHLGIRAVAVHLARADRPAPDVELALPVPRRMKPESESGAVILIGLPVFVELVVPSGITMRMLLLM